MVKEILIGIKEQDLNEVAHYLMIYLPYNEELCSYTIIGRVNFMKISTLWSLMECGQL